MTLGRETTEESIFWNPGEPKGKDINGKEVEAPDVPSPDEAKDAENEKLKEDDDNG